MLRQAPGLMKIELSGTKGTKKKRKCVFSPRKISFPFLFVPDHTRCSVHFVGVSDKYDVNAEYSKCITGVQQVY